MKKQNKEQHVILQSRSLAFTSPKAGSWTMKSKKDYDRKRSKAEVRNMTKDY